MSVSTFWTIHSCECSFLLLAAHSREIEVLQYLIDLGIDVNQRSSCGFSALECALVDEICFYSRSGKSMRFETRDGTPRYRQRKDITRFQIAQLLLASGTDLNGGDLRDTDENYHWQRRTSRRLTPLQRACTSGDLETAKLLLAHGADIDRKYPIISCLTINPCRIGTPFAQACRFNHLDLAKYLLQNGAEINPPADYAPTNPLHLAVNDSSIEVVLFLLREGADLFAPLWTGSVPCL